ncbi:MAG: hypothetical protein H7330_15135 [Hymenobacteraceae bacterium]|nr:hypothetical protein [Hymenobacteraceae bacterium]
MPGTYLNLFGAVHQTIRHGAPYPVLAAELLEQLTLLELPAASIADFSAS